MYVQAKFSYSPFARYTRLRRLELGDSLSLLSHNCTVRSAKRLDKARNIYGQPWRSNEASHQGNSVRCTGLCWLLALTKLNAGKQTQGGSNKRKYMGIATSCIDMSRIRNFLICASFCLHTGNGDRLRENSPMEHDPLSSSCNAVMTLIQGRELGQYGIVCV